MFYLFIYVFILFSIHSRVYLLFIHLLLWIYLFLLRFLFYCFFFLSIFFRSFLFIHSSHSLSLAATHCSLSRNLLITSIFFFSFLSPSSHIPSWQEHILTSSRYSSFTMFFLPHFLSGHYSARFLQSSVRYCNSSFSEISLGLLLSWSFVCLMRDRKCLHPLKCCSYYTS